VRVEGKRLSEFEDLLANALKAGRVIAFPQRPGDPTPYLPHFRFLHSARRQGRRTDADAARLEGRIGVEWYRVLIYRDAGFTQRFFSFAAQHALRENVHQHEMGVSASGDDAEASSGQ